MIFSAPAILTRIAMLKDGGLSLGFSTNELTTEEKILVFSFYQQFGHVLFKSDPFVDEDIPEGKASDESKTPSQRLRAALYILWKQQKRKEEFESFYRRHMESAIDRVKELLE